MSKKLVREPKSLRLGFGEVGVDWGRVALARSYFMGVADRFYPELRVTLEGLLPWFRETHDKYPEFLAEDWFDTPIGEWCRRWSLIDVNRKPVPWAVEMAYKTLDVLRCGFPFVWHIDGGGGTPDVPEANPKLGELALHRRTLLALKNDIPKSQHAELTEQLSAYVAAGWEKTPQLQSEAVWEWAVHLSVGGLSHTDLLGANHWLDEKRLNHEVKNVLTRMDWDAFQSARAPGRPSRVPGLLMAIERDGGWEKIIAALKFQTVDELARKYQVSRPVFTKLLHADEVRSTRVREALLERKKSGR